MKLVVASLTVVGVLSVALLAPAFGGAATTRRTTVRPVIVQTPGACEVGTYTAIDAAVLRAGPGTRYPVLGYLAAGTVAHAIGCSGAWLDWSDGAFTDSASMRDDG